MTGSRVSGFKFSGAQFLAAVIDIGYLTQRLRGSVADRENSYSVEGEAIPVFGKTVIYRGLEVHERSGANLTLPNRQAAGGGRHGRSLSRPRHSPKPRRGFETAVCYP